MRSELAGLQSLVLPGTAGPNDPALIIGPDIDATIQAYYTGLGFTVISNIIFRVDATTAGYIAEIGFSGASIVAYGSYRSITGVQETMRHAGNFGLLTPATVTLGHDPLLSPVWAATAWPNPLAEIPSGVTFTIDGVNQGRGLRAQVDATANTAAIGAEAIAMTLPAMDFLDKRAYEVEAEMRIDSSAANIASMRIRKTNLAGASLIYEQYQRGGAWSTTEHFKGRIVRTAGSDLTGVVLVLTLQASAGTVTGRGAADTVRWVEVRDIGLASQYPNAIAIV